MKISILKKLTATALLGVSLVPFLSQHSFSMSPEELDEAINQTAQHFARSVKIANPTLRPDMEEAALSPSTTTEIQVLEARSAAIGERFRSIEAQRDTLNPIEWENLYNPLFNEQFSIQHEITRLRGTPHLITQEEIARAERDKELAGLCLVGLVLQKHYNLSASALNKDAVNKHGSRGYTVSIVQATSYEGSDREVVITDILSGGRQPGKIFHSRTHHTNLPLLNPSFYLKAGQCSLDAEVRWEGVKVIFNICSSYHLYTDSANEAAFRRGTITNPLKSGEIIFSLPSVAVAPSSVSSSSSSYYGGSNSASRSGVSPAAIDASVQQGPQIIPTGAPPMPPVPNLFPVSYPYQPNSAALGDEGVAPPSG